MRIGVRPAGAVLPRFSALWIGLCDGDSPETLKVPTPLKRALRAAEKDLSSKRGRVAVVHAERGRLFVAGLGARKAVNADGLRRAATVAARKAQGMGVREFSVWLPAVPGGVDAPTAVTALAEGFNDGGYAYNAFKTRPADRAAELESLIFYSARPSFEAAREAAQAARPVLEAVRYARDLENRPGNDLTPRAFADAARDVARAHGLGFKAFGPRELEKMGCGALLGVARGSSEEPRLFEMTYTPKGRPRATLVFVGKGITFDSGGISLKPAENMDRMKFDMCGAAAVVGAMQAIAQVKPDVQVVGLVATSENMPGSRAMKPGDILRAMNGTTIEITNTDAEGRLVLADALCYAERYKPAAVVDLATLTGACIIALGTVTSGVFASDEKLFERLMAASKLTGEPMWRMPLWDDYEDLMRSDAADIKNSSAVREGGACTAAIFLKRFTSYPWAHLDIAGVGHIDRERPHLARGGTGYGVRSLVRLAMDWE